MEIFRPDKPIGTREEDKFQRYEFAKRIADIVSTGTYATSLVVGVYGKWGEGKSSVLKCVQKEIGNRAVVINFNPWLFTDETQLLKSFFSSIAAALGTKLTGKVETQLKALEDYADAIGTIANTFAPGTGGLFSLGKKVAGKLKKDSIENLKTKVDDLIRDSKANFVIIFDDIDRLDINEVQAVFKLVKLVGDFPRTAYILSFDVDMVARALSTKYPGEGHNAGYNFLDKIVQMPLQLPKATPFALRSYTIGLLNNILDYLKISLSKDESEAFMMKFDKAFFPILLNPRLGIRYANSIGFSIPLLQNECNLSDLLTIEGIKIFYPSLYQFIRNNPDHFISNFSSADMGPARKETVTRAINAELAKCGPRNMDVQFMLQLLFPQTECLFGNMSYANDIFEDWYREKRICSPHYFERYFTYAVVQGDISDVFFTNLLSGLATEPMKVLKDRFEIDLPKIDAGNFLFKLKHLLADFNEQEASALAIVLAHFGNYFPDSYSKMAYTTKYEAVIIIKNLIKTIKVEERYKTAEQVIELAQPYDFAVEIFMKLSDKQHHITEPPTLTDQEVEIIAHIITRRFKDLTIAEWFEKYEDHILLKTFEVFHHLGRNEEIGNLMDEILQASPANSLSIIKIFTPTKVSSTKPEPFKAGFGLEEFANLRRFVNTKTLYEATIHAYGTPTPEPVSDELLGELTDKNLIASYQKMYEDVIKVISPSSTK